eukprot:gene12128-16236_t
MSDLISGVLQFHSKDNVSPHEYEMQLLAITLSKLCPELNIPNVISYKMETGVLKMEKISGMNISDWFGEDASEVPIEIMCKVQEIIKILYQHGIVYVDITGYNFIYDHNEDKIWIIDFEHSQKVSNCDVYDLEFMLKFINGYHGWNPDFA